MANGDATAQFLAGLQQSVTAVNETFLASIPGVTQATTAIAGFGSMVQRAQATTQLITGALNFLKTAQQQVALVSTMLTAQTTGQTLAQRLAAASTRIWATAQTALNNAFRANPIGFIVTALQLLIGALVTAYQNSQTFRNIVQGAFNAIRTVAVALFNAVRAAVMTVWPFIQGIVTGVVTAIRTVVQTSFTIVRSIVTTVFNAVLAVVTTVWNAIRSIITGAVNAVVSVIGGIRQVYTVISNAFTAARDAVSNAITAVVDFVRGLPGRVLSALGNIGSVLVDKGKALIEGFLNGIKNAAGAIVDTIKNFVTDLIPDFIKDVFGIGSPSKIMAGLGESIGEGLAVGIERSGRRVARAMNQLAPMPATGVVRGAAFRTGQAAFARELTAAGLTGAARGSGVNVNIYPRREQSEYEIGRIVARELAWAAKR